MLYNVVGMKTLEGPMDAQGTGLRWKGANAAFPMPMLPQITFYIFIPKINLLCLGFLLWDSEKNSARILKCGYYGPII